MSRKKDRCKRVGRGRVGFVMTLEDVVASTAASLLPPYFSLCPKVRVPVEDRVSACLQVSFSPDGRWLASTSFDKSIKLWNGISGAFAATLLGHVGPVYQAAWSSDSRLLVSASKDSTLKVR